MALSDKNLPEGLVADEILAAEIRSRLDPQGNIGCPEAFEIASAKAVEPMELGRTADALGIHLTRCQLGLYGYPGHAKGWTPETRAFQAPEGLAQALQAARDPSGKLRCAAIWAVAEEFGITRLQAGWQVESLGIKIHGCQLSAF